MQKSRQQESPEGEAVSLIAGQGLTCEAPGKKWEWEVIDGALTQAQKLGIARLIRSPVDGLERSVVDPNVRAVGKPNCTNPVYIATAEPLDEQLFRNAVSFSEASVDSLAVLSRLWPCRVFDAGIKSAEARLADERPASFACRTFTSHIASSRACVLSRGIVVEVGWFGRSDVNSQAAWIGAAKLQSVAPSAGRHKCVWPLCKEVTLLNLLPWTGSDVETQQEESHGDGRDVAAQTCGHQPWDERSYVVFENCVFRQKGVLKDDYFLWRQSLL